jgi:oxygen-independent coproporphyrinogen-3 oxidase
VASLYVHIPFCERKCLYCDFYSVERTGIAGDFLSALRREISLQGKYGDQTTFTTVFFGGGTPSLLEPGQIETILAGLRATFSITPGAEISLEANPGTVTAEKLRAFRSLGINRLSIGIQSFLDHELKFLGRIHDQVEGLRCYALARAAGFDNINLDLIYSIPGQTTGQWESNVRAAMDLAPEHVAAYSLTVEEETPLARLVQAGAVRTKPAWAEAGMYERAMELLHTGGYEHYEVSNYARPGFRCRHNWNYWSHENYLGLGPSAHSFWKEGDGTRARRWWNVPELSSYRDRLMEGSLPVASEEPVGTREMLRERILLGLRSGGLDLARLRVEFGYELEAQGGEIVRWMIHERLASLRGDLLCLTPKGYLLCDEICSRLTP